VSKVSTSRTKIGERTDQPVDLVTSGAKPITPGNWPTQPSSAT
jgi:hypothetical protein